MESPDFPIAYYISPGGRKCCVVARAVAKDGNLRTRLSSPGLCLATKKCPSTVVGGPSAIGGKLFGRVPSPGARPRTRTKLYRAPLSVSTISEILRNMGFARRQERIHYFPVFAHEFSLIETRQLSQRTITRNELRKCSYAHLYVGTISTLRD